MEQRLLGLNSVRVSKTFLLEKLQANRETHKKIYDEAMKGWHLKVVESLKAALKDAQKDELYEPTMFLPKPDGHVQDYDKIIDMLHASLDDEFILSSLEFSQYVRDEWMWKSAFTTTISGYCSTVQ
jgi:hypothetical protein